jgi:NTE family protein
MAARNFKNLVFEGGGVKGIAYGGALEVLEHLGILANIIRAGGTSAGAINAALFALGHSVDEISRTISETDFSTFTDRGYFMSMIPRLFRSYGINKGYVFSEFMRQKIEKKTGKSEFTFKDLNNAVKEGQPGFRDLYIVVTDLTNQKPMIYSFENPGSADMPIWQAVRMSMSIPLYFQAVKTRNAVFVDGGVSYNYAVNIFDEKRYLSMEGNGLANYYPGKTGKVFNYETLGFRLDSQSVIKYSHDDWAIPPQEINNLKDYVSALLNFMMEMANKSHLRSEDWNRTVFIDTLDVKTTDFSISPWKIRQLIESGRSCTEKYFEWRDKDQIWNKTPRYII